ncbi:hypothetical protein B0T25DRAFT_514165 [Lasiosphaeria hispida]|uniref:AB hydrolase-1 domain-containing protein n=1 Tax=Lasiosphaeria hispida TaxID=260671 RepID=A0AAJ0HX81_9PEZI|nr:hypothetical protein B0T25DRAFT_514165 [Lasiosphaeria hispida]
MGPAGGTYEVAGTYCLPKYNWHKFANDRGYGTLAIDRIGYSLSSHPEPLNVVQPKLHVAIIHQIFQAARTGAGPSGAVFGRKYEKVVYVGHSYGSNISSALGAAYPADADALVLTAYNSVLVTLHNLYDAVWASASVARKERFPGLPLGYIIPTNLTERIAGFYAGDYDAAIPPVDLDLGDIVTDGEVAALA